MELSVQTHYVEDLVLHCLAHMHVNNDSDLYDFEYIQEINLEKDRMNFPKDLEEHMSHLSKAYNENFERTSLVNFLPLYIQELEELQNVLLIHPYYNDTDLTEFLLPFVNLLHDEDIFYKEYWSRKTSDQHEVTQRFQLSMERMLSTITGISSLITFPICVYLQLSMTRAGRALMMGETDAIAVKYPQSEHNEIYSMLQALHELTHHYTDELMNCDLSMLDGTHKAAEHIVIVADYLLLKEYMPNLLQSYLQMINIDGMELEDLLAIYPVEEDILEKLREMFRIELVAIY